MRNRPLLALSVALGVSACTGKKTDTPPPPAPEGTQASFNIAADTASAVTFFDMPFPGDLRLTATGTPNLAGYPNPGRNTLVKNLIAVAAERKGWPVVPTAYFSFSAALADRHLTDPIAADKASPILLIDVDKAYGPQALEALKQVEHTLKIRVLYSAQNS
mgnify:CR=1 FL=1